MLNELILGRRIALNTGRPSDHDQPHHDPKEWRAFLLALDHPSPFERRKAK